MADRSGTGGKITTLVLGGARSGKSRYAETLIETLPPPWIYLATAEARDAEMEKRVAAHRARRGKDWRTIEAPNDLAGAIANAPKESAVLIDCLTLWLSNRMLAGADVDQEIERLEAALKMHEGTIVLVSNEVGLGIVPDNELARRFRDLQGMLNQKLAVQAARVVIMVAGVPVAVKSP